jgi:hypothetical protein
MTIEPAGSKGSKTSQQQGKGVARKSKVDARDGAVSAVDWVAVKAGALERGRKLRGADLAQTGFGRSEVSRGGASFSDAVQEAVTELHAQTVAGEPLPTEPDRLAALVLINARRRWKAWSKRAREQRTNLQSFAPTLGARELFELICARDEQLKLLTRLYHELRDEPEARLLLYLILEKGIQFHETRLLAEELATSTLQVTNMKRRIVRLAHKLMVELTGAAGRGGRT